MVNGIPIDRLDEETRKLLGIPEAPKFKHLGEDLTVIGRVFKALGDLSDDEALDILQRVQMFIIDRKNRPSPDQVSLPGVEPPSDYAPPLEWVLQIVAKFYRVKPSDLKQRSRESGVVEARHVAMFVLSMTDKYSLTQIGLAIGGRSPATVSHAFARIGDRYSKEPEFKAKVDDIRRMVSGT